MVVTDGEVLIAIKALRSRNGWDPSISEIATEVGRGRTSVFQRLARLRHEGAVELPRRFGGWRLTEHGPSTDGDRVGQR